MKIEYKRSLLYFYLAFGIFWIVLSLISFFTNVERTWFSYTYIIMGLTYIVLYINFKKKKYIIIENGSLTINGFLWKKNSINLSEIKSIKKFAGDYTIKTNNEELKISIDSINKNQLPKFNSELEKLNIEWL